jgi:hypothetical protein
MVPETYDHDSLLGMQIQLEYSVRFWEKRFQYPLAVSVLNGKYGFS